MRFGCNTFQSSALVAFGLGLRLFGFQVEDFTFEDPDLDTNHTVGGIGFGKAVSRYICMCRLSFRAEMLAKVAFENAKV